VIYWILTELQSYQTVYEISLPHKKKFNSILSIGDSVWVAGDDGAITVINKYTHEVLLATFIANTVTDS
jgi:hypothetical protein